MAAAESRGRRRGGLAVGVGLLNALLGIVVTVALARLVDRDEYGRYLLVLGVVRLALLPVEAGLPNLTMREIAKARAANDLGRVRPAVGWALRVAAVSLCFVALVAVAVRSVSVGGWPAFTPLEIAGAVLLIELVFLNLSRGALEGFNRPIEGAVPDSIIRPALLVCGVLGLSAVHPLDAGVVMALHVVATFIAAVVAALLSRGSIGPLSSNGRADSATLLRQLWPLSVIRGVRLVSRRLEILVLGAFAALADVADYNVALQIAGPLLIGQTALNSLLGPAVVRDVQAGNVERLQRMTNRSVLASTGFALVGFLGILIAGRQVIERLLGSEFESAYALAVVLGAGSVLSAATGPTTVLLNMADLERQTLRSGAIAATANVLMNFALVPAYGAAGAAVAATSAVAIIQMQRHYLVRRHLSIRPDILAALSALTVQPRRRGVQ